MIYNFIYNNISVEVNTEAQKITYTEPNFQNVKTVWYSRKFTVDDKDKTIVPLFETWKEDSNGSVISGTYGQMSTLNKNTTITETGVGQYDFFNNLQTGSRTMGDIANHARLNNLLENLVNVFGDKIPCFNPYSTPAWSFFHPIQLNVIATSETELRNDATIEVEVVNLVEGLSYEYSLNDSEYTSNSLFLGLSNGTYVIKARSTTELVPKQVIITIG